MLTARTLASILYLTSSAFLRSSAATLERRASVSSYPVSVSRGSEATGFTDVQDALYSATIVVNGVSYQVQLDTGSADTWIDPLSVGGVVPPNLIYTGYNATTPYLDGSVGTGPIVLADVSFGPYTLKNQAITLGYGNGNSIQMNGLLGLGGSSQSMIYKTLMNTSYADNGRAMLYNMFAHEPDRPDYITWLMSRTDVGDADGGVFTVWEVLANMTDILDAPQLNSLHKGDWTYWIDGIYVNGRYVGGHSNVTHVYNEAGITVPSDNSTAATFDTGSSAILAPEYYVHQIYQDVPGASATYIDGPPRMLVHNIPCDTKLNISWSFAYVPLAIIYFLLGDAFLRNVYHLYGYGNSSDVDAKPYIQLLSVVDEATAWAEADTMIQARIQAYQQYATASLSSIPATVRPSYTGKLTPASFTYISQSTSAAAGDVHLAAAAALAASGSEGSVIDLASLERNSYIIMGLLGGVIVLLLEVVGVSLKAARANRRYEPLVPPVGSSKAFEAAMPYDS
ncbi:acid protease [Lentinus brumalis]|uniref:Acid protease n=1 Tax=Lentinus brumalis TaxID=2498619 RepID=A0A371DI59_9APHY|nr:acid protease [Polyporus brumalis]